MYKIHEFMGVDNYEVLCENPDHEESTIYFSNNFLFGFIYLKLVDCALMHSKGDIMKSHHDKSDLNSEARYPRGETLGFYNFMGITILVQVSFTIYFSYSIPHHHCLKT